MAHRVTWPLIAPFTAGALLLVACGSSSDDAQPGGSAGGGGTSNGGAGGAGGAAMATLTVHALDADTEEGLAGALVSIERGGIYLKNADTSKGNPHYQIGGEADATGTFTIPVPNDTLGLHVFAPGYYYGPGSAEVTGDMEMTIYVKPLLPMVAEPTLSGLVAEPTTVAAGETFTLSVDVNASSADDPLSDETLVIEATHFWTAALDPPSPGEQGVGYPDGAYSLTIEAPMESGTYTYFVTTTSEGCVTSQPVSVDIEVM